jgi:acyl-CoA synthetase (AMP-forming)/AMP-acid ligase II
MDEIDQVFIIDRKKDMINTAGFEVFPADIERVRIGENLSPEPEAGRLTALATVRTGHTEMAGWPDAYDNDIRKR